MFEFRRLYCAHAELHAPFTFEGLLYELKHVVLRYMIQWIVVDTGKGITLIASIAIYVDSDVYMSQSKMLQE